MRRLIRGIGRKTVDALSLDRVSERYQALILNYLFLILYTTLESVFVNTLLYTVVPDLSIVIVYRAIVFATVGVTMQVAAYVGHRKTPVTAVRVGAFLYLAMYLVLFFGLSHMRVVMVPVALLSGAGCGFYWSGHNSLVPHYTTKFNRDVALSIQGVVQGVMTLLAPVVSGFVIARLPGTLGYRVMFGVGMAAVGAQLLVQRRLTPVEPKKHVSQVRLAFKMLRRKLSLKLVLVFELVRGLRDGAVTFLFNMLVFEIVADEALVGVNSFLSGCAAIAGAWVYGRFVTRPMRAKVVVAGAVLLCLLALPLLRWMNVVIVIAYSLVSAFVTLFLINPCTNTTFDAVAGNETMRGCMGELLAFREAALNLGRLGGFAVLMILPHTQEGYVHSLLLLTGAQIFCGLLLYLAMKTLDRKMTQPPPTLPVPVHGEELL